jgi:Protein of unknown function (DUF2933)
MSEETRHDESAWRPRVKFVFLAFAVIGAFFLLAEHRAHVLPWLPWLFLAACPFMHFFMHHGHGDHDHHGGRDGSDGRPNAEPGPGSTAPPGPGYTGSGSTSRHHRGDRS